MKSILFTALTFPPHIGGAERQAERLAFELAKRGFKIIVITAQFPGFIKQELFNNIIIYRLPIWPWIKGLKKLAIYFYYINLVIELIVRQKEYNIIYSYGTYERTSLIISIIAKLLRKKAVIKFAAPTFLSTENKSFVFKLRYLIISKVDALISNSKYYYNNLQKSDYFFDDKLYFIPSGISTTLNHTLTCENEFIFNKDKIYIINVSSFQSGKNQEILIRNLPKLINPNIEIIFIGEEKDKRYFKKCKYLIDEYKLNRRVHILGKRNNVKYFLQRSDIFVFPSLSENMSSALLEAMANKLPCIVYDTPGNTDIIDHGKNGLIFKNDADLLKCIQDVIENRNLRKKLGYSAYKLVSEKYTIEKVCDSYIVIFNKLLD